MEWIEMAPAVSASATTVSLETRRELVNPRFENYILNTTGVASISRSPLPRPYGFDKVASPSTLPLQKLHFRARFNHLFHNPYHSAAILYIDQDYTLQYGCITSVENAAPAFAALFSLTAPSSTVHEYPSAIFASKNDLVASNGATQLVWLQLSDDHVVSLASNIPFTSTAPPILVAARKRDERLCAMVLTMEETPRESNASSRSRLPETPMKIVFTLSLLDVTLDGNGNCRCDIVMAVQGDTPPYFVHLDDDGLAFTVASEMLYELIKSTHHVSRSTLDSNTTAEKPPPSNYQWSQTSDELVITILLPFSIPPSQLVVNFTPSRVTIASRPPHPSPHVILNKAFFDTVLPSESVWTIESNKIITLNVAKNVSSSTLVGSKWPQLFKSGDDGGVGESIDPSEALSISERLEAFTSDGIDGVSTSSILQNQIGEAPEPEDYETSRATIMRFARDALSAIQKCDTEGYEWISNSMNSMLLKRDVDGVVFDTSFAHVATFPALAYISASKRWKRFIVYPDEGVHKGEQNVVDLTLGSKEEQEILGARIVQDGYTICCITNTDVVVNNYKYDVHCIVKGGRHR
ncbi:hypothetical protein SeMB42_g02001 [Synchytrium endobioticum]|uniref:NudC domain-containing protein 1 n=1 Tax=Synchytrium endobioticum TaxID=286115 RepID=A0A507DHR2_9FUNG|nr:hypothetical protein SeMB42_g02001 [Synchytrium endobioticum]